MKRNFFFLLNGTSARGFDGSGFYSQKWKKIGTTIFTSYNYNGAYDPADNGFTAIPKTSRFTFNPKVYLYLTDRTTGWFGVNTTFEVRFGGDLRVIEGKPDGAHTFFERNKSSRISTQLSLTHRIDSISAINVKNTVGFFDRRLALSSNNFNGNRVSSFSEFSYSKNGRRSDWVTGLNVWSDRFNANGLDYNLTTAGAFAQNTFKASEWFFLETGLRADYNSPASNDAGNGVFLLPRINALFKINEHFTSRIGGGMGYKMPSPFNEEAEERGYQGIQPISFAATRAEQSYGGNAGVNSRTSIGKALA